MSSSLLAVTGATGAIGGGVARALWTAGLPIRLVVRDPSRAPDLPGASVVQASYAEPAAMRKALQGVGTLFLVSAAESVDRRAQHLAAVRAARDAGVDRVVYTSFLGAAADATFTLVRDHFATEQALRESGMRWTFLRNSLYADLLAVFATDGVLRGPAGEGRVSAVARADIVEAAVVALRTDGHDGRTYDLTGPAALTLTEVAATLSRVTGRPYRYEPETVEQAWQSRAVYAAPDWQIEAWVSTYTAIAAGELSLVSNDIAKVTGHQPLTFEQVVASQ